MVYSLAVESMSVAAVAEVDHAGLWSDFDVVATRDTSCDIKWPKSISPVNNHLKHNYYKTVNALFLVAQWIH